LMPYKGKKNNKSQNLMKMICLWFKRKRHQS
jgi:hypothetical protein